jgi:hypothetical protein
MTNTDVLMGLAISVACFMLGVIIAHWAQWRFPRLLPPNLRGEHWEPCIHHRYRIPRAIHNNMCAKHLREMDYVEVDGKWYWNRRGELIESKVR